MMWDKAFLFFVELKGGALLNFSYIQYRPQLYTHFRPQHHIVLQHQLRTHHSLYHHPPLQLVWRSRPILLIVVWSTPPTLRRSGPIEEDVKTQRARSLERTYL